MADLNQIMDVDPRPPVPPHQSNSSGFWDKANVEETINGAITQMLDPLRLAIREEVSNAIAQQNPELKSLRQGHLGVIADFQEQLEGTKAEKNSLSDVISQHKEEILQLRVAIRERDTRNKQLQRVIIENSQSTNPPMDEEIVALFNELNHDIMKAVKKHFTKSFGSGDSDRLNWKEYKSLSPENRELWVRALIADDLYHAFFARKQRVFGLDGKWEDHMRSFELMLEDSGRVSEADKNDWRIRTVSCARKLDLERPFRDIRDQVHDIVKDLRFIGPSKLAEEREAEQNMLKIYNRALDIAMLFRSNAVPYTWLQRKSLASIEGSESETIGSITPNRLAAHCKPWRIVFGGAIKNQDSEEDRVVLTKSELLVA